MSIKKAPFSQTLLAGVASAALLVLSPAQASVEGSLDAFFNDLDYNTHVSNPTAYKGQAANYYSGGSLFLRSGVLDVTPTQFTLPDISAGCGGIDMFLGGFSHINSDQLVAMAKSIIADAIPFGVDLALQTWAPQIKSIRDNLQAVADKYLNQSVNSCEAAQAGISALAGFAGVGSQKYICSVMGTQNNTFSDWVEAQQECGAGGQADTQLDQARKDPALKDMVRKNHNLIWGVLLKNSFLAEDTQLAEFFQSLSGTIIYDKDGNPITYNGLLSDNNNLIDALLSGNRKAGQKQAVRIYECDDTSQDGCLHISQQNLQIDSSKALQTRVEKILGKLVEKINQDRALSNQDKDFLEYAGMPALVLLKDSMEIGQEPPIPQYARVIAVTLVGRYLDRALFVINQSLNGSQLDPTDRDRLAQGVRDAQHFLSGLADDARQRILAQQELINNSRKIEQQLEGALSAQASANLRFTP